jgi:hypothetical protein
MAKVTVDAPTPSQRQWRRSPGATPTSEAMTSGPKKAIAAAVLAMLSCARHRIGSHVPARADRKQATVRTRPV